MKYMRQFGIILGVTCAGELMKYLIPLPIPGSIYCLLLMFVLLLTKVIKVENVKDVGEFLIEIMPLMFIPAGVGLLASWGELQGFLVPLLLITVSTTFIVILDVYKRQSGGSQRASVRYRQYAGASRGTGR